MDEKIEISWLLDFYGELLTEKQRSVLEMYFNEDASLSEIADTFGVSKQAVHDIINRSKGLLFGYEDKLGLLKQFKSMENGLKAFSKRLRECDFNTDKDLICNELDELIAMWEE